MLVAFEFGGEDDGDDDGEFIPLGPDENDFDDTRDIYPEDVSLAADADATQGTQGPEPSERNPEPKRLTQVVKPQDKAIPEIHFEVPIGNANKNLNLPNSITFSLFRGSVANVMGLTVAQLVLGYYFEWNMKGTKQPVPTVLQEENEFLDMMLAIQTHRREQERLLAQAKARKTNTSKFKELLRMNLMDLREAAGKQKA